MADTIEGCGHTCCPHPDEPTHRHIVPVGECHACTDPCRHECCADPTDPWHQHLFGPEDCPECNPEAVDGA